MMNKGFICNNCKKHFVVPVFYEEKHRLDTPPYERVAVCPSCNSGNFFEFDFVIDKIEVAERLLPVMTAINHYYDSLKDIYGNNVKNLELQSSIEAISEFISEMFNYLPTEIERKIINMNTAKECEAVLMYLRGEV